MSIMNQQKANGRWKDLAHQSAEWQEAQIDFINTMKVDFLILEKDEDTYKNIFISWASLPCWAALGSGSNACS
jgi:hypothetical protein